MVRLVIDTDPGVDDAHALLMALAHPDVQIEAITTVAGNVSVDRTTANACKILDVTGKDVPIFAGSARAMIARHADASLIHGEDGLGSCGIPASSRQPADEHAAQALVRLANASPGELTLAAIGPLTNIALATLLDPDLPQKYKRLVIMGGAIRGQGNTTPSTEFNVYTDPEAAAIVFEAWTGLEVISWETTLAHVFNESQVAALLAIETPRAEFFRRITAHTLAFIQRYLGQQMLFSADLLAVAVAVEPEIVRKSEHKYVEVELHGQQTRGQTTVDWNGLLRKEPNAHLVLELDQARLWELINLALK